MARLVSDLPGVKFRVTNIDTSKPGTMTVTIGMRVESWPRLLWHVVRRDYDVRWWQWPWALFAIARTSLRARNGTWPTHTSSGT